MRSLLLIAAVLVTAALSLEPDQQCEPGSTFKLDCNTCRCSNDGKLMSCTRKFCLPEEQGDDPKVQVTEVNPTVDDAEKGEVEVQTNGQVCTPNEVKMEDCNRCKCAANGIGWFCTRNACPPRERRFTGFQPTPPKQDCVPGTSFKSSDGCNDCYCGESGIAACTMKFCFPSKVKRDVAPKQECVPGTNFKSSDGCNDCFCTETGVAACTMKFCLPTRSKRDVAPKQECVPGTNFKSADGCNDCFCTETGVAACTMKFCLPTKSKRQVAPNQKCVPGTSFKSADGCNDCVCTRNGVAACTEKFCLSTKSKRDVTPKQECVPGTNFKSADGCNDCFCTETGVAACTMKFCMPTKSKRQVAPKKECEPGTSFKSADGCNDCFCSENGVAACTLRFCFSEPQSDNAEVLPVSLTPPGAPGFTCTPSKAFKYQCNTCWCDDTGSQAACTFKLCLPGEY